MKELTKQKYIKTKMNKIKQLLLGLLCAIFVTSCSSDAYNFEDGDGMAYVIADSKEYHEYVKALINLNNAEAVCNTKIYGTRTVYSDGTVVNNLDSVSMMEDRNEVVLMKKIVDIVYRQLVESYPYFNSFSNDVKIMMYNVALSSNKDLQKLDSKNPLKKYFTRVGENMNDAQIIQYQLANPSRGSSMPALSSVVYSSETAVIEACRQLGEKEKVEVGGYVFNDGSGLLITDIEGTQATETSMNMPHVECKYSFHYHPSIYGNTKQSDADRSYQNSAPKNGNSNQGMMIVTSDHGCVYYK